MEHVTWDVAILKSEAHGTDCDTVLVSTRVHPLLYASYTHVTIRAKEECSARKTSVSVVDGFESKSAAIASEQCAELEPCKDKWSSRVQPALTHEPKQNIRSEEVRPMEATTTTENSAWRFGLWACICGCIPRHHSMVVRPV